MEYDLKLTGGMIADGSGQPGFRGELAIANGKIAAMGPRVNGSAAREIDASGHVVAPGFVDIHTHYDAQVMWDRMLTISPWHGVTTVVMGNCGFGVAPTRREHRGLVMRTLEKVEGMSLDALESGLGYDWPFETFSQYLDTVDRRGTAINLGALIGHTPVRLYVMGEEATERAATSEEVAQMREIVREGIAAGALGFATSKSPTHVGYSGRPVPSRMSTFDEIKILAGALREAGRGVMQATIGRELFFKEFAEITRQTGRPITWTALLANGDGSLSHRSMLERSRELMAQGLRIFPQVTCRPLNFEYNFKEPFILESLSLFKQVSAADFEGKMRIYGDPAFRRALAEVSKSGRFGLNWGRTTISYSPLQPELEERNLAKVAAERGADPVSVALDLAVATGLEARFRTQIMNYDEDEVAGLLKDRQTTVLGLSDAGAHASQLCDACYATYLLGHWVREKSAFTLEEAVRMLTSRPAEVFEIRDRGRLAPQWPADVVVFDPETVGASALRRTHDMPASAERLVSDAQGIKAVIVNGTIIRYENRDVVDLDGPLPGQVLRSRPAES